MELSIWNSNIYYAKWYKKDRETQILYYFTDVWKRRMRRKRKGNTLDVTELTLDWRSHYWQKFCKLYQQIYLTLKSNIYNKKNAKEKIEWFILISVKNASVKKPLNVYLNHLNPQFNLADSVKTESCYSTFCRLNNSLKFSFQ